MEKFINNISMYGGGDTKMGKEYLLMAALGEDATVKKRKRKSKKRVKKRGKTR